MRDYQGKKFQAAAYRKLPHPPTNALILPVMISSACQYWQQWNRYLNQEKEFRARAAS